MDKSPIVIGSDHAAYQLKELIKNYLIENDIEVKDIGTQNESSVDYPDYGIKVASLVSAGEFTRGILLCGSGIGMSIVANRFSNIRAALCNDLFSAIISRKHNNSNVLVMGARIIGEALAVEILKSWLETAFEGGRHQQRIDIFNNLGNKL
ncbi:MAG: ribose 5-phosphate isomerase B [Proteobacteria bacterium]|nr:ribose 5-phosphate isomerase B [Pseudomonadota bacterium]MBU4010421.1 ribose 5-phosphate isomerase B [Pseudomonadota bacterium]